VQYSTVHHSAAQYSTVQYSAVQYSTVQHSAAQYSTVQYSTVEYSTVQYSTVQYSTVQYSTVHIYTNTVRRTKQLNNWEKCGLCSGIADYTLVVALLLRKKEREFSGRIGEECSWHDENRIYRREHT